MRAVIWLGLSYGMLWRGDKRGQTVSGIHAQTKRNTRSSLLPRACTTHPTHPPHPSPALTPCNPRNEPPPLLVLSVPRLKVVSSVKRASPSDSTNTSTGNACATATTTPAVSETPPPREEESPGLPTPPPRLESNSPYRSAGKMTCKEGPVPPAPPSGGSVSREREEGGSVVWPRGRGGEEDLSRLDELD